MRRRSIAGLALGVTAATLLTACSATGRTGPQPWAAATVAVAPADLPDDPAAVALLRSAADAATQTSFEAVTETRAADGTVTRVLVVHRPAVGTEIADPSSTRARGRLYPEGSEQPTFAGGLRFLDLLVDRFAVVLGAAGTALGRPADVVEARNGSGGVQARFWVDRATGLIVRRDVTGEDGSTRSASFARLTVPAPEGQPRTVATASSGPVLDDVAIERVRSEGWPCPEGLPGGLSLAVARESEGGAIHLVYSDGLEVISLFVQPGQLDPAMPGMERREIAGGPVLESSSGDRAWVWSTRGSVLTLMTDAPRSSVLRVIAALPPDPA